MSCIVVPRDGPLRIIPLTMAKRWKMVSDCLEELKEDTVEIPLDSSDTETWIDLDQRTESFYTVKEGEGRVVDLNAEGRRVPPLLDPTVVLRIANYMNPVSENWRFHYAPRPLVRTLKESDMIYPRRMKECYHKLGLLLVGMRLRSTGPYNQLFDDLESKTRTDDPEKRMILAAILYCDWLRNDTHPLCWMDVNWCAISALGLHYTFYRGYNLHRDPDDKSADCVLIALGGNPDTSEVFLPGERWINHLMGDNSTSHLAFWERILTYIVSGSLTLGGDTMKSWLDIAGISQIASLDFPDDKNQPGSTLAKVTLSIARGAIGGTWKHRDLIRRALHLYHQCILLQVPILNEK